MIILRKGEVRQQFNAISEGGDQQAIPISEMLKTAIAHGQNLPEVMFTDNPANDKRALMAAIPSLQQQQVPHTHTQLVKSRSATIPCIAFPQPIVPRPLLSHPNPRCFVWCVAPGVQDKVNQALPPEHRPLPLYAITTDRIQLLQRSQDQNAMLDSIKSSLLMQEPSTRVVSLDAEWRVVKGQPRQRIALIQVRGCVACALAADSCCAVPTASSLNVCGSCMCRVCGRLHTSMPTE